MGNCQSCQKEVESGYLLNFNWPREGRCKVISCGYKTSTPTSSVDQLDIQEVEYQTSKLAEAELDWKTSQNIMSFRYQERKGYTLDGEQISVFKGIQFNFEVNYLTGRYIRFSGSVNQIITEVLLLMGCNESFDQLQKEVKQTLQRNILQFTNIMWENWVGLWIQIPKDNQSVIQNANIINDQNSIRLQHEQQEFDPDLLKDVDEIIADLEYEADKVYLHHDAQSKIKVLTTMNKDTMQPLYAMRESHALVDFQKDYSKQETLSTDFNQIESSKSDTTVYQLYKAQLWIFDWMNENDVELMVNVQSQIKEFKDHIKDSVYNLLQGKQNEQPQQSEI